MTAVWMTGAETPVALTPKAAESVAADEVSVAAALETAARAAELLPPPSVSGMVSCEVMSTEPALMTNARMHVGSKHESDVFILSTRSAFLA